MSRSPWEVCPKPVRQGCCDVLCGDCRMPYAPETHANVSTRPRHWFVLRIKLLRRRWRSVDLGFWKETFFFSSGLECILKTSKLWLVAQPHLAHCCATCFSSRGPFHQQSRFMRRFLPIINSNFHLNFCTFLVCDQHMKCQVFCGKLGFSRQKMIKLRFVWNEVKATSGRARAGQLLGLPTPRFTQLTSDSLRDEIKRNEFAYQGFIFFVFFLCFTCWMFLFVLF